MRTNIEKELWSKYFPNEEFDYDNFYDWSRENAFELLPLALEFSEKIKQEYADEFACAFTEWIIESKYKLISIKKGIIYSDEDIVESDSVIKFYTTNELLEIYKQQINGL